ncbi:hypothetical protein [Methanosarcina siciliae]|uniref:hypothetical protein n=1 Tax=Methanosarcina siciliae TaxID=38027 RepID=UPI00064E3577|nr:hypothetical protein [Methanosarcina siciliae]
MGVNRILKYKKLFVVRATVPLPGLKSEARSLFFRKKIIKKNFYGLKVLHIERIKSIILEKV